MPDAPLVWSISAKSVMRPHECTLRGIQTRCDAMCCKTQAFVRLFGERAATVIRDEVRAGRDPFFMPPPPIYRSFLNESALAATNAPPVPLPPR